MKKDITNKSILVVGANGALAKETIKYLIKDGATQIVMACRTQSKGEAVLQEIKVEIPATKGINVSVVGGFDMTNPASIETSVKALSSERKFDIIFLAAGFAVFTEDYQAVEWNGKKVEKNVFQNMVGSHSTLMHLKKNNLISNGARIVMAGGEGARGIKGIIEKPVFKSSLEFRDYVYLKNTPKYNPMNAIGVSKLCGALWTAKISEMEKDNMEIIWFSPGLTSGSAGLHTLPIAKRSMMSFVFGIMSLMGKSQTPNAGGRKYADCLEGKVGKNGDLMGAPEGKSLGEITDQTPMNTAFSDKELIDEFWGILEEVLGKFDS